MNTTKSNNEPLQLVPPVEQLSAKEKINFIARVLSVSTTEKDSPANTLQNINTSLNTLIGTLPADYVNETFWHEKLNNEHKKTLKEMNDILKKDYAGRKEVLLKRFEATAQTFLWKDSLKSGGTDAEMSNEIKKMLSDQVPLASPEFDLYDIVSAPPDIVTLGVTRTKHRTDTGKQLREFVMNVQMPDRGGRATEGAREVNMPKFKDRKGAEHKPENFNLNLPSAGGSRSVTSTPRSSQPPADEPLSTITSARNPPTEPLHPPSPRENQGGTTSPKNQPLISPLLAPTTGGRQESNWSGHTTGGGGRGGRGGGRGGRGNRGGRFEYVKKEATSPRNDQPVTSPRDQSNNTGNDQPHPTSPRSDQPATSPRNDGGPKRAGGGGRGGRGGRGEGGTKRGRNAGGGWVRTVSFGNE
jgi:hypothetical protein